MSEWKKVILKDVSQYVNEKTPIASFDNSSYVNTDSMIKDKGGIIPPESIPSEGNVTKYQRGDILVSNIRPYFKKIWYSNREGGCSNDVLVFRAHKEISSKFLYYVLSCDSFFDHMMAGANGTKMPRGNKKLILTYTFKIPSLPTQERISNILFQYDSLISNFQKQIKLLEEAMQRLYEEWFIDFRYPGHENNKIVDDLPEGWEIKTIENICDLSKKIIQPSQIKEGCPYIGLEHMPRKDLCLSRWGNSEEITSSKYEYKEGDILFGKIRPYFHKVGFAINDGCASTDSIIMKSKPGLWALLLMTVFSEHFIKYTSQTCKEGAKMPRADWNQMKKYPVFIASDAIQQEFERQCKVIANKIKSNALQSHLLTEARDRLLPKLMSGEIEV